MFAERAAIGQAPQSQRQAPEAQAWAESQKKIVDAVVRVKHANFPSHSQEESDTLYDLWKHYTTRADYLKDKLWTTGTWLIALTGGLLALLINTEVVQFRDGLVRFIDIDPACVAIGISLMGACIALYSTQVIRDFRKHVVQNWWRANYVLTHCVAKPAKDRFQGATILESIVCVLLALHLYIFVAAIGALEPLESAARALIADSGEVVGVVRELPASAPGR